MQFYSVKMHCFYFTMHSNHIENSRSPWNPSQHMGDEMVLSAAVAFPAGYLFFQREDKSHPPITAQHRRLRALMQAVALLLSRLDNRRLSSLAGDHGGLNEVFRSATDLFEWLWPLSLYLTSNTALPGSSFAVFCSENGECVRSGTLWFMQGLLQLPRIRLQIIDTNKKNQTPTTWGICIAAVTTSVQRNWANWKLK